MPQAISREYLCASRALLSLLLCTLVECAAPATLGISRIRILLCSTERQLTPQVDFCEIEPSIDALYIPTELPGGVVMEEHRKFLRIYFPRTYQRLSSYDIIYFPDVKIFLPEHMAWMVQAVRDAGASMICSGMSQSAENYIPLINSILADVLPSDYAAVARSSMDNPISSSGVWRIRVNEEAPAPMLTPFIPLGIESVPGACGRNQIPKEGSLVWAWFVGGFRRNDVPYLLSIGYGRGTGWSLGDCFMRDWWSTQNNPYALDIYVNWIWQSAGRNPASDAALVHSVRAMFGQYRLNKLLLLSLMDFAETFGASTVSINVRLSEVDRTKNEAEDLYLGQDIPAASEGMEGAIARIQGLIGRASELKNKALLWVYSLEWLTMTATALVAGVVLWTLMIRRRMYTEVGATRYFG